MTTELRVSVGIAALVLFLVILTLLKRGRLPIRYSLFWILSGVILFIVAVVPSLVGMITNLLGFKMSSNMIIVLFIAVLLFLTLSLTVIVSGQSTKINLLIQEISLLKEEVNKKNK